MESGWINVEVEVSVRKYEVDTKRLAKLLSAHKKAKKLTNEQVALILNKPKTLVEHWFRQDTYFAIPDEDIWYQLKELLGIETDEFDKQIMTFEIKGGCFDMRNRIYFGDISPTLTIGSGNNFYLVEK